MVVCKKLGRTSLEIKASKQDDGSHRFFPVLLVTKEGFTRNQVGDRIYNPTMGVPIPEEVLPEVQQFMKELDLKDITTWKKEAISELARF